MLCVHIYTFPVIIYHLIDFYYLILFALRPNWSCVSI